MTVGFFEDPENRAILRICRTSPGFIPIVSKGRLHPVREVDVASYPVSPTLTAEDYALGLEVLGCRMLRDPADNVVVEEPAAFKTSVWRERARKIQAIMTDEWEGRRTDLSDYLFAREGK